MRKIDFSVRKDFEILNKNENLIYFNSSETTLKPKVVIDEIKKNYNSIPLMTRNLSTYDNNYTNEEIFFKVINNVAKHINSNIENVIPTYGTTDAINNIARKLISEMNDGDEIILGRQEHSSNILAWTQIAKELNKNILFKWYELKDWKVDLDHLKTLLTDKTKVMSVALTYNTTGSTNDLQAIRNVLGNEIKIFVDAAQSIGHMKIDVSYGDIDFLVFGSHKAFGVNNLGFMYAKDLLKLKLPFIYGGKMNISYDENNIIFNEGRYKFLAGTQDFSGVLAFGKALEYIEEFGVEQIEKYTTDLKKYAEEEISKLPGVNVINKGVYGSILFFELKNIAGEDIEYHLMNKNIFIRSGASCVKMNKGYDAHKALRVSFHIYNSKSEIDKMIKVIRDGGDFIDALFSKRPVSKICV